MSRSVRRFEPIRGVRAPRAIRAASLVIAVAIAAGCASSESLRPPAPPLGQSPPLPDPEPARVVLHATILGSAIEAQLEARIPLEGTGEIPIVGKEAIAYRFTRGPMRVRFDRGSVQVSTEVVAKVRFLGDHEVPIRIAIGADPVVSADYKAQLQSLDIQVTARSSLDMVNHPIEDRLRATLRSLIEPFQLDLAPLLGGAWQRIARPMPFAVAGRTACAELRVTSIEAGPNVLAGGLEKDFGVVVLPQITLPCPRDERGEGAGAVPLPPLENVPMVPPGPFHVTVPIAADYGELSQALATRVGGRLRFSTEYPDLYLEAPEVYPSRDTVVIKLVLGGKARIAGIDTSLKGELFFSGHPRVVDNQLVVPDLELTPGTADGLLKLKVLLDGKGIRDQAQAALRVDLSERMYAARDKLGAQLSFDTGGAGPAGASDGGDKATSGCVRAEVLRTEVTAIYPHDTFLRIYVSLDAQAALYLPCPR